MCVDLFDLDSNQRANSVEDAVRRGQRQVEQVKLKMSMQMDDKTFQACLLETQVPLTISQRGHLSLVLRSQSRKITQSGTSKHCKKSLMAHYLIQSEWKRQSGAQGLCAD